MKIKANPHSIVLALLFLILFLICISSTVSASTMPISNSAGNGAVTNTEPYTFVTKWGSYGSEDGQFYYPASVAVDSSGNIYVADLSNNRIQKFDSNGNFIIKWGSYGSEDGQFYYPVDIALDSLGNVYVADLNNNRIQKFDVNGNFITKWDSSGSGGGQFSGPYDVAVDSSGNVYVADLSNSRIQKFDSSGTFLTKWGSPGTDDGQFNYPIGVALDSSDNVYIAENANNRIQKFDSNGNFITKWGSSGSEDGQFNYPIDVAVDYLDNVYVIDQSNNRIQKFDVNGNFITKWGSYGSEYGQFDYPFGVAVDSSGNVYVADLNNNRIQKFAPIETPKPPAPVREITVDNSKADFTSIQEAVNNSVPGDTIIVAPGTYTENVVVDVPGITIRSESNHGSVQVKPLDESKSTFMITADSTTIIGLNITGASQDFDKSAIGLYSNMNNLTGNTIENGCILLGSERSDNLIAENKISNDGGEGIHISCCGFDTNIISNNTISRCSVGIYEYDQAADVRNNRITDCNFGIELAQASSVIDNNIILNCDIGILLREGCNVDIVNNKIMSCEECGIFDQENFGGQRIYNNYFNNILNVKLGPEKGGNTWNTSLTQGTNIAGGPYIGGNFWANPEGTGFSQTSVDLDRNGIGDLPYNVSEGEFDYLPLVSLSSLPDPVIPTANFTASVTSGTAPVLVQFTDLSENAVEWNWDFGDGTSSTEQNPVHTYLTAGNYTVILTVSNIDGTDSKLSTITVSRPVVPDKPKETNFSSNVTNVSTPVNVQIGNLSQSANEINWNIGSQHLGTNFSNNGQNVSSPVTVQIGNVSQNATTINWNIHA